MRVEEKFLIVPIGTELTEDIYLYYTSNDNTQKIVKYWVTVIDEPYKRTYIDATTLEEKETVLIPGVYGRPTIYIEGNTEYTEEQIQTIMGTEGWKPMMENYN